MWMMSNELLQKLGLYNKFGWILLPSTLEGHHEEILEPLDFTIPLLVDYPLQNSSVLRPPRNKGRGK